MGSVQASISSLGDMKDIQNSLAEVSNDWRQGINTIEPAVCKICWDATQSAYLSHGESEEYIFRCTIESILSGCITAWYGNCTAHNCRALQREVRSAQRITGGKLPALQDTYNTRCHRKAKKIIKDNNHTSHCVFTPLPPRRRVLSVCRVLCSQPVMLDCGRVHTG
ncbi:uncharacterized protein ACWYII_000281 [Salvelinus alpinus]